MTRPGYSVDAARLRLLPGMNQITVVDETTGTALLFQGATQEQVLARMTAWADHGEPPWTRRAAIGAGFGFSLDDLDNAVIDGQLAKDLEGVRRHNHPTGFQPGSRMSS